MEGHQLGFIIFQWSAAQLHLHFTQNVTSVCVCVCVCVEKHSGELFTVVIKLCSNCFEALFKLPKQRYNAKMASFGEKNLFPLFFCFDYSKNFYCSYCSFSLKIKKGFFLQIYFEKILPIFFNFCCWRNCGWPNLLCETTKYECYYSPLPPGTLNFSLIKNCNEQRKILKVKTGNGAQNRFYVTEGGELSWGSPS